MTRAFHDHHRRKGDRTDNRAVNILKVDFEVHEWIEKHPEEARELGWSVSRYDDPESVSVVIPKSILEKPKRERKPRAEEKPRNRATISFAVPKDKREDGAGLFDDLWGQAVEKLSEGSEGVSTEGATGQYGTLLAVLYYFVTNY